ncbi:hypothetical protein U4E84_01840 [Halorubrum sp. AD140]|uniref:hypothetical protein n=1 Tax=Halorubrum sp. AD140 TaxID=3050073 RepID=UPI002ACC9B4F|nr:hypothetical protein [Halorubrum sp. AD140]MDZ5810096.1 hypothetical protein [Halorubrum sp. AD140]
MTETESTTDAFDRDAVRSASRVAIAALALVGVSYLFTLLPGVDRLVPLTPVTFAAVASAVVTAAVVALLLYAAPKVASLTRAALHRTDAAIHVERIAENGGAMAHWLVVLAAVLVAHRGFAGVVVPLIDGFAWAYDAAFLVASFVPLVFVVARLTVTVDPLSEVVADRVAGSESADETDHDAAAPDAQPAGGDPDDSAAASPPGDDESLAGSVDDRWSAAGGEKSGTTGDATDDATGGDATDRDATDRDATDRDATDRDAAGS